MGCLLVDSKGEPLGRSIIWVAMSSVKQADLVEKSVGMQPFYRMVGHRISPSYSLTKLLWIKKVSVPQYLEQATSIGAAVYGGVGATRTDCTTNSYQLMKVG